MTMHFQKNHPEKAVKHQMHQQITYMHRLNAAKVACKVHTPKKWTKKTQVHAMNTYHNFQNSAISSKRPRIMVTYCLIVGQSTLAIEIWLKQLLNVVYMYLHVVKTPA